MQKRLTRFPKPAQLCNFLDVCPVKKNSLHPFPMPTQLPLQYANSIIHVGTRCKQPSPTFKAYLKHQSPRSPLSTVQAIY